MNEKEMTKKSKFLSLVLRHKPEEIGLNIDDRGWANTGELCRLSHITFTELKEIVATNNKKRFEFDEHEEYIRACQGHSIDVDLGLDPVIPPPILYHGTAMGFIDSIKSLGLVAGKRTHVHLSGDYETAIKVGSRHGKPVVLKIDADSMANDGYEFYLSTNKVWLTDSIPFKYITIDWTTQGG